ncbi:14604_t:CDS:2 [Dentiscutata heterogama]|uniref:14604_t:CDS:1 n=1 Tax=Dentiscutata heterogama TaxID=1316150 RepID=A0ACA9LKT4_9GLOM|nr:14604_t:CDS:2 [Dentiscutata heterogama]
MVILRSSVFILLLSLVTISLGNPVPCTHTTTHPATTHKSTPTPTCTEKKLPPPPPPKKIANPKSTLATILENAVYFTNVSDSLPTDSFPGLMAQITGGKPATTGVWYDNSWDGTYFKPGSNCTGDPGLNVLWDESLDLDQNKLNTTINQTALPERLDKDGCCVKVQPWDFLRVNTIFEVAKNHSLTTAWVDKLPAYSIVNGPSGKGVDDFWGPEIASINKTDVTQVEQYDNNHTVAILNWINGRRANGTSFKVPNIFGGNFQTVSVAQKSPDGGYKDGDATPSDVLKGAFKYVDGILKKFLDELTKKNLLDDTIIIISAKHGQSPINRTLLHRIDDSNLTSQVGADKINQLTDDDVALFWLKDHNDSSAAADSLRNNASDLGIATVYEGDSLKEEFGCCPTEDTRCPDIAIKVTPGVIYSLSTKKIAEHGGFNEDDYHVPIIVYNPKIKRKEVCDKFETRSIAPFILSVLGIDEKELEAVVKDNTPTLPVFDK